VNPDASKVAFTLGGNTHHVDGTFHVQSGSIDYAAHRPSQDRWSSPRAAATAAIRAAIKR
jgi:hypothetical protein